MCIYPIGTTDACQIASEHLHNLGIGLTDHPCPEITHLLLDIPSFQADGNLRGGGDLKTLLRMLPDHITVIGGNLDHPLLEKYRKMDLLKNPDYLSHNAAITADCAIRLAGQYMKHTFSDSPALVLGSGRISKCLCLMLRALGTPVTVAARNHSACGMLRTLGIEAISISQIPRFLAQQRLLFNTIPAAVLEEPIPSGCVALELASKPGIPTEGTIPAGGLPGKMAPHSSGLLIAQSILAFLKEEHL